ncbi:diapophytoene dehydrogenase [Blastocystis sp. subtype 4]|uniref:diapophytoene dehydrogenase n=1 Tax=Blastocystis sp. subtype 4 TaxID=944170 RepID=UPI00071215C1|nr:diapophytoene dehydrogenase [Blastocystis sp. subtype 4]KNB45688.1 diapophytoene dehydrogenase [Blastocystis sp. subtype 4]|eukprot:XP_014529130.1 diapophytoene dehydrogenase [Blastocystis sp. subtype 4]
MFAVKKLITPLKTVARIGKMNISSTSALFEKFNILVPPMGESIKNGTLVQWEKQPGEFVDQLLKPTKYRKFVSMDVRCDKAGYLVKQLAKPDDTVNVGAVIAEMNTEKC